MLPGAKAPLLSLLSPKWPLPLPTLSRPLLPLPTSPLMPRRPFSPTTLRWPLLPLPTSPPPRWPFPLPTLRRPLLPPPTSLPPGRCAFPSRPLPPVPRLLFSAEKEPLRPPPLPGTTWREREEGEGMTQEGYCGD